MNIDNLILTGTIFGAAAGYLGSFMVVKRMSLTGDALSHVALPGIALALMWGINPMIGAFAALIIAVITIWYLSANTEIYPEALVGIFFTASLSLGLLLTPEPELLESLFGDIDTIGNLESYFTVIGSVIVFFVTKYISKKLILGVVSEDLAKSQKIKLDTINLVYLLLVGLVVALGIKFLGTLLTGAMVIIPGAIAKNISSSMRSFQVNAIAVGSICSFLGIWVARSYDISSGPSVVLVGTILFVLSFVFKK